MDYREVAIECVKDCVLPIHQQIYAKYGGVFDRIYGRSTTYTCRQSDISSYLPLGCKLPRYSLGDIPRCFLQYRLK